MPLFAMSRLDNDENKSDILISFYGVKAMVKFNSDDFKSEKLPTLLQAIKSGKVIEKRYPVMKVWYPNAFPVLTLETDTFRFNVQTRTNNYEELCEVLEQCSLTENALFVDIQSVKPLQFEVLTVPNEKCNWRGIGESGLIAEGFYKVEATPPKKTVAKKTQKNEANQNS